MSNSVTDKSSNETLIGANIIVHTLQTGAISNEYGFYSLTLGKGVYEFQISYLGYTSIAQTIQLDKNQTLNFKLSTSSESLDEVVILEDVEKLSIRKPQMSLNSLSISTIKQIPVVLGEVDLIKSITLLPGVTTAGEGASGFNVRGGAADQNLILLDEATIFNSSHLFGFFSVFNSDALKDVKLYKGGAPAEFGGRLSSVMDIKMKEGNMKSYHGAASIGQVKIWKGLMLLIIYAVLSLLKI